MNKLKKVLSAVVDASSRPTETWRFLRQAVREVRVVLQGVTALVGELEERLDRLEAAATHSGSAAARSARSPAPRRRKPAATQGETKRRAPSKRATGRKRAQS